MERLIKTSITAVVALFFGTASGCVMDDHQQNISSVSDSYHPVYDNSEMYPVTALSNSEIFDRNSVVVRELDIPDRFFNVRSINRCSINTENAGCSGGCVTL